MMDSRRHHKEPGLDGVETPVQPAGPPHVYFCLLSPGRLRWASSPVWLALTGSGQSGRSEHENMIA
jgi:hypothetical protein